MDPTLSRLLSLAVGFAALSAVFLVSYSWVRSHRASYEDFRRAAYLATLGDVATRAGYPSQLVRGWARDRVFRTALVEFLTFLTGTERNNLLRAAHELEIVERYRDDLCRGRRRRTRVAAAEALGDLADPSALPELVARLSDRVPEVRVQSAHALAAIGDPLTVPTIFDALITERERWVAERLADALRRFDTAAVPEIALRLKVIGSDAQPPGWATLAARVVGAVGDPLGESALVHCLSSRDRRLREAAATGLGGAGTLQSVRLLVEATADPIPAVRRAAITALGRHFEPSALEAGEELLHDNDPAVRRAAAEALSSIPGGQDALIEALRLGDPTARRAAADAVLSQGMYRAATVRIKTQQDTPRDRHLVDGIAATGRLEDIPSDPYEKLAS